MKDINTAALRALAEKATPGPWQWFGNTKMHEVYLATVDRGRVFVMDFERWGMGGAQPRFQVRLDGSPGSGIMRKLSDLDGDNAPKMLGSHRKEFVGIGHPDAAFIAAANPQTVIALLDELAAMTKARDEVQFKLSTLAEQYTDLEAKHRAATSALTMVSAAPDNVWHWQGDGGDHPESLSCPVVMSADALNAIIAARDEACDLIEATLVARTGDIAADMRAQSASLRLVGNVAAGKGG